MLTSFINNVNLSRTLENNNVLCYQEINEVISSINYYEEELTLHCVMGFHDHFFFSFEILMMFLFLNFEIALQVSYSNSALEEYFYVHMHQIMSKLLTKKYASLWFHYDLKLKISLLM